MHTNTASCIPNNAQRIVNQETFMLLPHQIARLRRFKTQSHDISKSKVMKSTTFANLKIYTLTSYQFRWPSSNTQPPFQNLPILCMTGKWHFKKKHVLALQNTITSWYEPSNTRRSLIHEAPDISQGWKFRSTLSKNKSWRQHLRFFSKYLRKMRPSFFKVIIQFNCPALSFDAVHIITSCWQGQSLHTRWYSW